VPDGVLYRFVEGVLVQRTKAPLRVERGRAGWVGQSPLRRDQIRLKLSACSPSTRVA